MLTKIESVPGKGPSITLSLSLRDNLTWEVHVLGVHVPAYSQVLHGPDTLRTLAEVENLVTRINHSKICLGNPDSRFLAIQGRKKGLIMGKSGTCICGYSVNAFIIKITHV